MPFGQTPILQADVEQCIDSKLGMPECITFVPIIKDILSDTNHMISYDIIPFSDSLVMPPGQAPILKANFFTEE